MNVKTKTNNDDKYFIFELNKEHIFSYYTSKKKLLNTVYFLNI